MESIDISNKCWENNIVDYYFVAFKPVVQTSASKNFILESIFLISCKCEKYSFCHYHIASVN